MRWKKPQCRVAGGFRHRRPALQVVRKIVEEESAGKQPPDGLQQESGDASADVQTLFTEALQRMKNEVC